jgi:hypothetical protein
MKTLLNAVRNSLVGRAFGFAHKFFIDRVVLSGAVIGYLLPALLGDSFHFTGGIWASLGAGLAFIASSFAVLAVIVRFWPGLKTMAPRKQAPIGSALFAVFTAAWLAAVTYVAPAFLAVNGIIAYAVSTAALLGVAMLVTGKPSSRRCSGNCGRVACNGSCGNCSGCGRSGGCGK